MKIVVTAGARPNFVKVAPLIKEMQRYPALLPVLIHTGQHYDHMMSEQFFTELDLQPPTINLGVGSGSHATQTAEVLHRTERRTGRSGRHAEKHYIQHHARRGQAFKGSGVAPRSH